MKIRNTFWFGWSGLRKADPKVKNELYLRRNSKLSLKQLSKQ